MANLLWSLAKLGAWQHSEYAGELMRWASQRLPAFTPQVLLTFQAALSIPLPPEWILNFAEYEIAETECSILL